MSFLTYRYKRFTLSFSFVVFWDEEFETASESGWMERPNVLEWFRKLVLPAVSGLLKSGPVLLFVDGHLSHISLELIRLAREKGVMLICLPSHTTHALQPLDVGVYGPLKNCWGKSLKREYF